MGNPSIRYALLPARFLSILSTGLLIGFPGTARAIVFLNTSDEKTADSSHAGSAPASADPAAPAPQSIVAPAQSPAEGPARSPAVPTPVPVARLRTGSVPGKP